MLGVILDEPHLTPQFWTIEDVRYRLTDAADTLKLMPVPHRGRPEGYRTGWPDVVYEWTAYGYTPATLRRSPPTALQIDKLDLTLEWLHWLTRDQRMIVWARANGWTWRKIEDLDEPKHRRERQLYNICDDGYQRILAKLNGTPGRLVIDPLDAGEDPLKKSIAGIAGKMV